MLAASGPALPVAGGAKAAMQMGAQIAVPTIVGGLMGGEKGMMQGLLGGVISAGIGGLGGLGKSTALGTGTGASAPDIAKTAGSLDIAKDAIPSVSTSSLEALGKTGPTVSTPKLDAAAGKGFALEQPPQPSIFTQSEAVPTTGTVPLSKNSFTDSLLSSLSSNQSTGGGVRAPSVTSGTASAAGSTVQNQPQNATQMDILDKIFQQQRQLNEENYRRNMRSGIMGTATKSLMGGISSYFSNKAQEEEPTPYTGNIEMAAERGRQRALNRLNRRSALRQAMYPKLGRV